MLPRAWSFDMGQRTGLGKRSVAWHSIRSSPEVGAFYWTVLAPDIVNLGREEQGSVSL